MASSRLPDKPLADIAGVPMVVRVAQRAAQSGAQHVVVATDDERILVACERCGVRALMTDAHHPSGTDRIAQAARLLGLPGDAVIVNVQGDEPLIDPEHIRSVAQCLSTDPSCNMATLAHPIHAHEDFINPNIVTVLAPGANKAFNIAAAGVAAACTLKVLPSRRMTKVESHPSSRTAVATSSTETNACLVWPSPKIRILPCGRSTPTMGDSHTSMNASGRSTCW